MKPPRSVLDPKFKYVPAKDMHTNYLREKFQQMQREKDKTAVVDITARKARNG